MTALFALAASNIVLAGFFLTLLDQSARRHAAQVAELCQRIQAPDTAVATHVVQQVQAPSHLPFDDDQAFMDYMSGVKTNG